MILSVTHLWLKSNPITERVQAHKLLNVTFFKSSVQNKQQHNKERPCWLKHMCGNISVWEPWLSVFDHKKTISCCYFLSGTFLVSVHTPDTTKDGLCTDVRKMVGIPMERMNPHTAQSKIMCSVTSNWWQHSQICLEVWLRECVRMRVLDRAQCVPSLRHECFWYTDNKSMGLIQELLVWTDSFFSERTVEQRICGIRHTVRLSPRGKNTRLTQESKCLNLTPLNMIQRYRE